MGQLLDGTGICVCLLSCTSIPQTLQPVVCRIKDPSLVVQIHATHNKVEQLHQVEGFSASQDVVLENAHGRLANIVRTVSSNQQSTAVAKSPRVFAGILENKVCGELSPLYKAIVRPHLEYCIHAWSPYLRKDIDMLEKIQRRTTKLIPGLRDLRYEERLKECGLTTLETRRLRGDQIEVFKILNGYENIDSNIFLEIKQSKITRGHNFTLVKKQSRLDVRKFSFSQRTINVWNKLSTECVHASSVNMFKNKIDKYLVKAGYT